MKKRVNTHILIWVYGVSIVTASTVTMMLIFYYAYLNNYRLCVTVNDFGEFIPEVIILLTGLIAFIYETIRRFKPPIA